MAKNAEVRRYLEEKQWLPGIEEICFLAAGEYNANYLVRAAAGEYVLRLNHGSQLGLSEQISYEFAVLKAVEASGVTPRAYHVDQHPGDLAEGVLLMEYLPGRPLDYRRDLAGAAAVLARLHALPPAPALLRQPDPVAAIAAESLALIGRYPDHPLAAVREDLLAYHEKILRLAESSRALLADEPACIVNTEVNSHNFIVQENRLCLVDWEKAVVSCRYQDLGHFLVPTTTLWKSRERLGEAETHRFLNAYRRELGLPMDMEELYEKTMLLERTILLRALSWCYMAWYEYTHQARALKNRATFRKIKTYLRERECFLRS